MRNLLLPACWIALAAACAHAGEPFVIEVVDAETGRGVPMVELETVNGVLFVTDSNGLVALDEPGFNGRETYFHVRAHGYEYPADGFGFRGVRLDVEPGGTATVKVNRLNIAQRLYRITGEGIYRDTLVAGREAPIDKPALNAGVLGQDSTQAVVYRGKVYWFWGDTNLAHYPLGHFGMACATSPLPGDAQNPDALHPDKGVNLTYLVDDAAGKGNSRPTFTMDKPGVIWAHGIFVVPDKDGRERMVTHWARLKGLGERLEHGLAVWNDDTRMFDRIVTLPDDAAHYPRGHAVRYTPEAGDTEYVYFADPYLSVRVPATYEAAIDPSMYEPVDGKPEGDARPVDAATGDRIELQRGSIRFNAHRKKWIMIAGRIHGDRSFLGEIYYLEADSPLGPWPRAVRIVTHEKYTFYNPVHHAFLDPPVAPDTSDAPGGDAGRFIYFEGTYTHQFSGTERRTPRYDYNQIMYRLDLDDPRLRE